MLSHHHIKVGWRNILKYKKVSIINVLGLSLGMAACIIAFVICNYEFSFDAFHRDRDQLFRLAGKVDENNGKFFYVEDVPPQAPASLRHEISGIEKITAFYPFRTNITVFEGKDKPGHFDCTVENTTTTGVIFADASYFSVLQYEWLAGNPTISLSEPFQVVLTDEIAKKYFGDIPTSKILGKEIVYADSLIVHVSGIVKKWQGKTDFPFREFISFSSIRSSFLRTEMDKDSWRPGKGNTWAWSLVKLQKGIKIEEVYSQLPGFIRNHMEVDSLNKFSLVLQPLSDIHFNDAFDHDGMRKASLPTLYGIISAALFILIIASINFINLSTAQSIQRTKEISLRRLLGSDSLAIMLQFLVETTLIVLCAMIVAMVLALIVLLSFNDFLPNGLKLNLLSLKNIGFILSIIPITVLLAGLYPAKVICSPAPLQSVRETPGGASPQNWNFRKVLITVQFAFSLIFIISSVVIIKQLRFMRYTNFNFNSNAIVLVDNMDNSSGTKKVLAKQIGNIAGVEKIIFQNKTPIGSIVEEDIKFKNNVGFNEILCSLQSGDENLIPFYGMKIMVGNNLYHTDSLREFIINETMSKRLGFRNPGDALGKFIYRQDRAFPIVGVVEDFHEGSFHEIIGPMVIGHIPELENNAAIKLALQGKSMENATATLAKIDAAWKVNFPGRSFQYRFMNDVISQMYEREQKTYKLMISSMLLSVFISCIGLFGLIIFVAERKKKEINIRKVLGASAPNIIVLLCRDFVFLIIVGLLLATPVSYFLMNNWLNNFAYKTGISWWIFILAGIVTVFFTIITVASQCIRVASESPVKSIRRG